MSIKSLIRTIPDYPKPGVQFRDITSLLENAKGLRLAVAGLAEPFRGDQIEKVAGIEARGFLCHALSVPGVPTRPMGCAVMARGWCRPRAAWPAVHTARPAWDKGQ